MEDYHPNEQSVFESPYEQFVDESPPEQSVVDLQSVGEALRYVKKASAPDSNRCMGWS